MQIIVIGMHRSGTSMISGLLESMGCFFGYETFRMLPAADNPKGFWERNDVKELNDYILAAAGGSWWDVAALDFSSIPSKDLEFITKNIKTILREMNQHRPWFIKDPRMCLTLPFWIELLENPVFVHVLRHPLQIAKSLQKRNSLPEEYSLCLWEFYNLTLLKNLDKKKKMEVSYNAFIEKPYENTLRIYNFLNKQPNGSGLNKLNRQEVENFIDPALCHFDETNDAADLITPEQYNLFKKLHGSDFYSPSAEEIKKATEKMTQSKIQSDWYNQMSGRVNAELADTKIKNIEKENAGLKIEKNSLESKNTGLEIEKSRLESKNTGLEIEKSRLESENTGLEIEKSRLESENAKLKHFHRETTDRLTALFNSRSIRGLAFLSRVLRGRKKGVPAEMVEIKKILEAIENDKSQTEKSSAQISSVLTYLPNTKLLMQIITLRRIKTSFKLLLESKKNYPVIKKRFNEFKKIAQTVHKNILNERELNIIDRYSLPESSDSKRPDALTSEQATQFFKDLKDLSKEVVSKTPRFPVVSIIIPVYNQIRFTLACIHSIMESDWCYEYEIIIADDNSTDQTEALFRQNFPGIRYLRHESNLGFIENCNNAAKIANGKYLIFLNNDTIVMKDWLDELINTFEYAPEIGLAGSKLVYPEGRLQEAGGIVFCDGSAWNYGRLQDSFDPKFNYARDADYCSGASLAIRAELWDEIGGFDTLYRPAYYEDTDLAFKVRNSGYKVVYQPLSTVVHFEGISSGKSERSGTKKYQRINKGKFYSKWIETLEKYGPRDPEKLPVNRFIRGKVLMIDATTPTPDKDSGSMDAFNYMKILKEIGFHVSFIPFDAVYRDKYTADLQRIGIECLYLPWIKTVNDAAKKMASNFDIIILCRVKTAASVLNTILSCASKSKLIFDTVDLHYLREEREAKLLKSEHITKTAEKTRKLELEIIRQCNISFFRSTYEIELVKKMVPEANLVHLPIVRKMPVLPKTSFENRENIVFIGGFAHPPNIDAVKYFVSDVWPLIRPVYGGKFIIAGSSLPDEIKALASEDIIIKGYVKNLSDLFNSCLLTVAPLRYGAGTKGKVITSLSYGVPCVATSVAAEGCGFVDGKHLIIADEPIAMAKKIMNLVNDQKFWQQISEAGLTYCSQNFSEDAIKQKLDNIMKEFYSL